MKKIYSCVSGPVLWMMLFSVFYPNIVLAWSSYNYKPTHQRILKEAYAKLKQDPAFKVNKDIFPSLDEILANEGVFPDPSTFKLVGSGPDGDGNTYYSSHYFNPSVKDNPYQPGKTPGYAPEMVGSNMACLADPGVKVLKDKHAAWGAHFMADLSVPFHVNGNYYLYINKLQPELDARVTGIPRTMGFMSVTEHSSNFQQEIDLFYRDGFEKSEKADWFDPWYYNGNTIDIASLVRTYKPLFDIIKIKQTTMGPSTFTSSHVVWEIMVPDRDKYDLSGTGLKWENPESGFDVPWLKQGTAAKAFAMSVAKKTRNNAGDYILNPDTAMKNAVESVYQMWRASFSGLRLSFTHEPFRDPKDSAYDNTFRFAVTALNYANKKVEDVQIRATVLNGDLVKKDVFPEQVNIKSLAAGETGGKASNMSLWFVKPANNECMVVMEITGRYNETPDLQYYMTRQPLAPVSALSVLVVDSKDNKGIPGALVSIADQRFTAVKTDESGSVIVPGLTAGEYKIRAVASRYKMNSTKVTLSAGENNWLARISLEKKDTMAAGAKLTAEQEAAQSRDRILAEYKVIAPLWAAWADSEWDRKGVFDKTIFDVLAAPVGNSYRVAGHKVGRDRETGKEFKASAWDMTFSLSELESLTSGKIQELIRNNKKDLVNKALMDNDLVPMDLR